MYDVYLSDFISSIRLKSFHLVDHFNVIDTGCDHSVKSKYSGHADCVP